MRYKDFPLMLRLHIVTVCVALAFFTSAVSLTGCGIAEEPDSASDPVGEADSPSAEMSKLTELARDAYKELSRDDQRKHIERMYRLHAAQHAFDEAEAYFNDMYPDGADESIDALAKLLYGVVVGLFHAGESIREAHDRDYVRRWVDVIVSHQPDLAARDWSWEGLQVPSDQRILRRLLAIYLLGDRVGSAETSRLLPICRDILNFDQPEDAPATVRMRWSELRLLVALKAESWEDFSRWRDCSTLEGEKERTAFISDYWRFIKSPTSRGWLKDWDESGYGKLLARIEAAASDKASANNEANLDKAIKKVASSSSTVEEKRDLYVHVFDAAVQLELGAIEAQAISRLMDKGACQELEHVIRSLMERGKVADAERLWEKRPECADNPQVFGAMAYGYAINKRCREAHDRIDRWVDARDRPLDIADVVSLLPSYGRCGDFEAGLEIASQFPAFNWPKNGGGNGMGSYFEERFFSEMCRGYWEKVRDANELEKKMRQFGLSSKARLDSVWTVINVSILPADRSWPALFQFL